jgi:hypothetical protein
LHSNSLQCHIVRFYSRSSHANPQRCSTYNHADQQRTSQKHSERRRTIAEGGGMGRVSRSAFGRIDAGGLCWPSVACPRSAAHPVRPSTFLARSASPASENPAGQWYAASLPAATTTTPGKRHLYLSWQPPPAALRCQPARRQAAPSHSLMRKRRPSQTLRGYGAAATKTHIHGLRAHPGLAASRRCASHPRCIVVRDTAATRLAGSATLISAVAAPRRPASPPPPHRPARQGAAPPSRLPPIALRRARRQPPTVAKLAERSAGSGSATRLAGDGDRDQRGGRTEAERRTGFNAPGATTAPMGRAYGSVVICLWRGSRPGYPQRAMGGARSARAVGPLAAHRLGPPWSALRAGQRAVEEQPQRWPARWANRVE